MDMVERAAKAIQETADVDFNHVVDNPEACARAALLAALDPEDEALVEAVAKRICINQARDADTAALDWSINRDCFRGYAASAIAALKAHAAIYVSEGV